jgi:hypothetical protein
MPNNNKVLYREKKVCDEFIANLFLSNFTRAIEERGYESNEMELPIECCQCMERSMRQTSLQNWIIYSA